MNGWLLYCRHCLQIDVSTKSQMKQRQFQSTIVTTLLMAGKEQKQQRGRASFTPPPKKKTKSHATPTPVNDVRYDGTGHLPDI